VQSTTPQQHEIHVCSQADNLCRYHPWNEMLDIWHLRPLTGLPKLLQEQFSP
jgi:hypothetical protein